MIVSAVPAYHKVQHGLATHHQKSVSRTNVLHRGTRLGFQLIQSMVLFFRLSFFPSRSLFPIHVPSLKLTVRTLTNGWETTFLLGRPILRCYVMLVLGRVASMVFTQELFSPKNSQPFTFLFQTRSVPVPTPIIILMISAGVVALVALVVSQRRRFVNTSNRSNPLLSAGIRWSKSSRYII